MILAENYDIQKRENYWRKYWQKNKIYKFQEESKKLVFSVDTPPPYVSAEHLHAGHIMSYAQAEFVVRFKRMQGFEVFYPMGFDDNGLPTERFVEKKYNIDKSKISRRDFIKLCLKETKSGSQNYKKLWDALGISVDWTKTYSTINSHCQKISQESFIDLYKKGLVYQAEQPMLWCPQCQTAIAQADLEDKQEKSYLSFIEFDKNLIIATTRPELLESCVALFFNPQDKRYQNIKKTKVPLFNFEVPVLFDKNIDPKFGTGLIMVCTWGDLEDIKKWQEHKLETRPIFTEKTKPEKILEKRQNILQKLQKASLLKKQELINHVLNIHERCGTPVEFILTKQWFIKLLENKKDFIKRGQELKWFPGFMQRRYADWVKNLKWDWCISRQRYYGVPFPVWYDKSGNPVLAKKTELPVDPTEKPKKNLTPETDVMDTWATSALTPEIIGKFPKTLRPQAFEIIRTWLFYSIVKAHYHHNKLPFRDVMISGHGLDEQGRKISKRLGNYQDPQKIISQYGADALRYWATGARLGQNMRYSEKEVQKGKRTVIKIFNASRFVILNLENFKPDKNFKPSNPEDKLLLHEMQKTICKTTECFEKYEYFKARNIIDKFFWQEFCSKYIELSKNRQDQDNKNCLYFCLINILKLYGPILPFITEEIWHQLGNKNSIHLTQWPKFS
ncbi:MAG: valine--tRNA ligase [bacterium]